MRCLLRRKLNLFIMMLILFNGYSSANALKLTITPKQDLHAGRVNDGAELATIHVSGMSDSCVLNVWIDPPSQETLPGHYILTNNRNSEIKLNVKLSGDNWQPDISSGRGIRMIIPEKTTSLRLSAAGDQTFMSNTLPVKLTAMCIPSSAIRAW